jgi:TM2 domain-containing membrane protein YozV
MNETTTTRRKDPGVAALLSVFVTGLGQIYNEEIGKGLLFMIIQAINVALMALLIGFITFPILWVWAIWDAKVTAERLNMG